MLVEGGVQQCVIVPTGPISENYRPTEQLDGELCSNLAMRRPGWDRNSTSDESSVRSEESGTEAAHCVRRAEKLDVLVESMWRTQRCDLRHVHTLPVRLLRVLDD